MISAGIAIQNWVKIFYEVTQVPVVELKQLPDKRKLQAYFGMSPHQIIRQERLETYWSILGGCIEHRQGFVFQCEDEEEADELKKLTYSMVFRLYDQWTVRLDGLIIKANPP